MSEGFNAAERKDVRAAEKAARIAERERQDVIRNLCSTYAGRRYIWERLASAGIFVAVPPTDALQMAFAEGIRSQGLALLNDVLTACPDQYVRMMQESNERNLTQRSPAGERSSSPDGDGGTEEPGPDSDYVNGASEDRAQPGFNFEA